jgi:hypothetical protein
MNFDPPAPSGLKVEGGISVSAEGSLYGGSGLGVEAMAGGGQSLGAEFDFDTGETTVYYAINQEVAGQLGINVLPWVGGGASGELSSELVIGLTVDGNLQPTGLEIGHTFAGSGGFQAMADLGFGGVELDGGWNPAHSAFAISATAGIDLTDPRLAGLGRDLFGAFENMDPVDLALAGAAIQDYLLHETDLEVQVHTGEHDAFQFGARGGKGWAFGFGLEHERTDIELAGAFHRPPGGTFGPAICG